MAGKRVGVGAKAKILNMSIDPVSGFAHHEIQGNCNGPFTPKIFYIGWTLDGHWTEWVPVQYFVAFTHIGCRKDGPWIYRGLSVPH